MSASDQWHDYQRASHEVSEGMAPKPVRRTYGSMTYEYFEERGKTRVAMFDRHNRFSGFFTLER